MGAFSDNDKDWNRDPNNNRSGSTGSDNSAPENDNAGTAKGNGGKGFEYPGLSNTNTGSGTPDISGDGSGASDNFEYGDDSVAGEYDVRESITAARPVRTDMPGIPSTKDTATRQFLKSIIPK